MDDKRCRVCLCLEEYSISLSASTITGEKYLSFSDIIATCCGIKISEDDGKPKNICIKCAYSARTIYDFKIRCMNSDFIVQNELDKSSQLRQNIKKEPYTEEDDSTNNNLRENTEACCSSIVTSTSTSTKNEAIANIFESMNAIDSSECDDMEDLRNASNMFDSAPVVNNEFNTVGNKQNTANKFGDTAIADSSKCNEADTSNIFINVAQKINANIPLHSKANNSPLLSKANLEQACKYCKFTAINESELKRHITARHDLNKYEYCVYCNDVFYTKQQLTTHVNENHYDDLPTKYYSLNCDYCGASFTLYSSLISHTLTYHSKKYKCDFILRTNKKCGKSFTSKVCLLQHKEQHNRNMEDKCYICQSNFRGKIEMMAHLKKTHKNRKCGICKKSFISSIALNAHMGDTQHLKVLEEY